jgi:hypothetical protein
MTLLQAESVGRIIRFLAKIEVIDYELEKSLYRRLVKRWDR